MNAGMAKVFREYILKKTEELKTEQANSQSMGKEALKIKLAKWQKLVDADKKARGGDEEDAWNLAKKQDEELKLAEDKTKQVLEQQSRIAYNADELFYRILRVERMADKVKDFASAKDMAKIMSDINAINSQLNSNSNPNSRVPTGQSRRQ